MNFDSVFYLSDSHYYDETSRSIEVDMSGILDDVEKENTNAAQTLPTSSSLQPIVPDPEIPGSPHKHRLKRPKRLRNMVTSCKKRNKVRRVYIFNDSDSEND